MAFYGCNDTTKAPKQDTSKSVIAQDSTAPKSTTSTKAATPVEPAQNASGVWHYTCRLGCPGGAGKAANCSNCGNVLAHNTTYHANPDANTSTSFSNPSATPAAAPEPSQNAAGVWHYTCEKGCLGGAGAAGTCNSCGGTLAHNSAYH